MAAFIIKHPRQQDQGFYYYFPHHHDGARAVHATTVSGMSLSRFLKRLTCGHHTTPLQQAHGVPVRTQEERGARCAASTHLQWVRMQAHVRRLAALEPDERNEAQSRLLRGIQLPRALPGEAGQHLHSKAKLINMLGVL